MTKWTNIRRIDSRETTVRKYVFEADDAVAEAVLYGYPDHRTRTVICCSTQSGCPIGCRFCGSGDSFVRSLTPKEIVEQVRHCITETGVDPNDMGRLQVMFMSMGEPLLNRAGLEPALRELHRLYPRAALLISTSAPDVDYNWLGALSVKIPTIGLQFSVHESTDEARDKLVPFQRKLTLAQIADTGYRWHEATGRQPFFNYCAHERNTSDLDAARLADLFSPAVWQATVSVVCERDETVAAANARQRALAADFQQKLLCRGFSTRMFDPAGQDDVGGGCGQLWYVQSWMARHPTLARPSVGRLLPVIHAPRLG